MIRISEKEVIQVNKLDYNKRYSYFIKRLADQQEACVLKDSENKYIFYVVANTLVLPIFSSIEFAEQFLNSKSLHAETHTADFDELKNIIYPEVRLKMAGMYIMPVEGNSNNISKLDNLLNDLLQYIEDWYG